MKVNCVNASLPMAKEQTKVCPSFGHVIPVKVKLDNVFLANINENRKILDFIIKSFNIRIGKGNGLFSKIAKDFGKTDADFQKNSIINSVFKNFGNGYREKFLVTGEELFKLKNMAYQICATGFHKTEKMAIDYTKMVNSFVDNPSRRISGISDYVIEVASSLKKHKDGSSSTSYKIINGYFRPAKEALKVKDKIPLNDTNSLVQKFSAPEKNFFKPEKPVQLELKFLPY